MELSIADRGKQMRPLPTAVVKTVTTVVRIVLGAVFLFSSAGKIADPGAFAAILINYQLLFPPLVPATAMVVPWIEAVCGLALVFGRFEKGASLLVSLMMILFIGILFYNRYRGLNIACGCFSLAADAPSDIVLDTLRNLLILAAGAWVLFYPRGRRPASVR